MENFLEQREQSDACISYAESRQNRAKTMENFLEQRGHIPLSQQADSSPNQRSSKIGRRLLTIDIL
jgi:hypothetical protein